MTSTDLDFIRLVVDGDIAQVTRRLAANPGPLHLANHTTGRVGSASAHAREQQAGIIRLLLERGA